MNEETKSKINKLLSKDKTKTILILASVVLVIILFLFGRSSKDENPSISTYQASDTQKYREVLSEEILTMVESVSGTGRAKILLTLDSSYEYIYLDDEETLRKVLEPQIRGVVVTCEGGDSAKVRQEITDLLTTALGIPGTKVCVKKLI